MNNTPVDLNNMIFAQLKRLSVEEISDENLKREIERSKPITALAIQAISNYHLALDVKRFEAGGDHLRVGQKQSPMLEDKNNA